MPRVKILKEKYAAEDLRTAIRVGIAKIGVKDYEVAQMIGMTPPTFSSRKANPDELKIRELRGLYQSRVLTEDDILHYIKGGINR